MHPSRKIDDLKLSKIFDELLELRKSSSPKNGDHSAIGKDIDVRTALELGGELLFGLVGWAVAHEVGKVINRNNKRFLKIISPENSHDMEIAGVENWNKLNSQDKIIVLSLLSQFKLLPLPQELHEDLYQDFKGFIYGDQPRILKPLKKGSRKVKKEHLYRVRESILLHRAYKRGLYELKPKDKNRLRSKEHSINYRKVDEEIAKKIGVEPAIFRKWENTWPEGLLGIKKINELGLAAANAYKIKRLDPRVSDANLSPEAVWCLLELNKYPLSELKNSLRENRNKHKKKL